MENSESATSKGEGAIGMSKDLIYGIVIAVLVGLVVVSVFTQGFGLIKPNVQENQTTEPTKLSDAVLKSKFETYINENLLASGYTAVVTKIEPYDDHVSLAMIDIKQGTSVLQSTQGYIANDGTSIFLGEAFRLNESLNRTSTDNSTEPETPQVTQTARPEAQAFVMSFCPYGLQFLKAYVPVMELLGDKADLEVGFVDYAMHGQKELEGNSYIYCVQKEEKPKLTSYLRCFVEAGNYTSCVATAGIDEAKISTCVAQLDSQYNITGLYNDHSTWAGGNFPQYPVQSALNAQYGVQGSPTFVLNGEQVSVARSAEAIKQAICASFTDPPEECNTELRTTAESPGLGTIGGGSTSGSTASCG